MTDVILTAFLLTAILLMGDVFVTMYFVGIEEFEAPLYVHRIPGGAIYWFLVKGAK